VLLALEVEELDELEEEDEAREVVELDTEEVDVLGDCVKMIRDPAAMTMITMITTAPTMLEMAFELIPRLFRTL
jgi:hypothetical protein